MASDHALPFLTYLLVNHHIFHILNFELYAESWEWHRLGKYVVHGNGLLLSVCSIPESIVTALRIMHLNPSAACVVELDQEGLLVPYPQSPEPPMTPELLSMSVVYTKLSWANI